MNSTFLKSRALEPCGSGVGGGGGGAGGGAGIMPDVALEHGSGTGCCTARCFRKQSAPDSTCTPGWNVHRSHPRVSAQAEQQPSRLHAQAN
eukprot:SAG31_NODE_13092_length_893_cov_1.278338_1_plen_90_part_10